MLKECRNTHGKLQHLWHWKEMPDGSDITVGSYDLLMKECAEVAEKLDEGLAGVKGQLSARASRLKAK